MCGRFTYLYKWREIYRLLMMRGEPRLEQLPLRYNIAPTQDALVAFQVAGGERELRMFRWGLVPWWSKDEKSGARMINARAETVATNPAFRDAFKERRCLVPASGFYEWQKLGEGTRKQPWYIRVGGGEAFCFAGLWDRWKSPEHGDLYTFTIITTTPNELMRPLHDRMPAVLAPEDYARWLDGTDDPKPLTELLAPYPAQEMDAYRVSTRVNSTARDDAGCMEPTPEPREREGMLFQERDPTSLSVPRPPPTSPPPP